MRVLMNMMVIMMKKVNNFKKYLRDKTHWTSLAVDCIWETKSTMGCMFLACLTELQRASGRADLKYEEGQLYPLSGTWGTKAVATRLDKCSVMRGWKEKGSGAKAGKRTSIQCRGPRRDSRPGICSSDINYIRWFSPAMKREFKIHSWLYRWFGGKREYME